MNSCFNGDFYLRRGALENDKQVLYFYMILVTIGIVLSALAIMSYIIKANDNGYLMILLGFILMINYINYLEKKAGISRKIIRIRNSVYTVLVFSLSYFLYF